jgi:hypothetical protein
MKAGTGIKYTAEEYDHVEKIRTEFDAFRTRNNYVDVNIDSPTILDVVRHLLASLNTHKTIYGQDADKYSLTAYWVCWLVKFKPAYLRHGNLALEEIDERFGQYYESRYNTINEHFAFGLALDRLDIPPSEVDGKLKERFIEAIYTYNFDPALLAVTFEVLFGYTDAKKRAKDAEDRIAKIGRLTGKTGH